MYYKIAKPMINGYKLSSYNNLWILFGIYVQTPDLFYHQLFGNTLAGCMMMNPWYLWIVTTNMGDFLWYKSRTEMFHGIWHTGSAWWCQPLWKIWKSIGMMIPNIWENKNHVPNHEPGMICHEMILDHRITVIDPVESSCIPTGCMMLKQWGG